MLKWVLTYESKIGALFWPSQCEAPQVGKYHGITYIFDFYFTKCFDFFQKPSFENYFSENLIF